MKQNNSQSHTEIASLRGAPPLPACYREAELPEHRNNPLIEALDPIFSFSTWARSIGNYPKFDAAIRNAQIEIRWQALQQIRTLIQPQDRHVRTAIKLDQLLRAGYVGRNPFCNGRIRLKSSETSTIEMEVARSNQEVISQHRSEELSQAMVRGMTLLALSGIGKSTLFRAILLNYPQVIHHSSYRDQGFMFQQIVWMMLECPYNGSRKQLIIKILNEIDALTGSNYRQTHGRGDVDILIPGLEQVNKVLRIGLIVIDEVQRLAHAHATSAQEMLNFLVQFSNTVRIPVIMTGTNLASKVLNSDLQQMRRSNACGDPLWPLPTEFAQDGDSLDPDWRVLLKALFNYQYVRNPVEFDRELSAAFFEKTQGITDLVVTLFILAQERVMHSASSAEPEILTPQLIRETADVEFRVLMPALKAIQYREADMLDRYEDLKLLFDQTYVSRSPLHEQQKAIEIRDAIQNALGAALNSDSPIGDNADTTNSEFQNAQELPEISPNITPDIPASKPSQPRRKKQAITDPNDLRSCETDETLTPKAAHEIWRRRGFTSSADDYISPE
jgi:hypothetical protein